jgi:hypothetical protein
MNGIENGVKRDPQRFFDFANYKRKTVGCPSSMRCNCPVEICELFADLFESVYKVDTCDSETEDVCDPSDGCGFIGIWLRMSDL